MSKASDNLRLRDELLNETLFRSLPPSGQAHYSGTGVDTYQLIFDITYKMRNLANEYYIYRVKQYQASLGAGAVFPDGFGAYEFLNYEIQNPRSAGWDSQDAGSDAEMFGLAGFSNPAALRVGEYSQRPNKM